ncbi:sister chromatid cohesion 1 protein 3-like isoform X1 [Raphanus sativus]|uniref:Sister chromatid cohesion 1 protein 3-like isoform X1 n=1 Tax=Raphanus sativus TaxID=3726 RepID=A0A6J0L771_RAPSA|nr:sister chromatid cohesion 1 protein 3-like isoform X1 [Raphanus sativus]
MKLKRRKEGRYLYIKDRITWKKFCLANEVSAEEPFILELTEKRELKFFSKVHNKTKRTGSLPESLNEKDPNPDEEVFTSERHQTSEFRSACPEEEHEHSVHPSPQPVLQSTPPPGPSIDKDVVLTNRATRSMLEDLSNTFRKRKKMPSWRFKALRPNKQCCSHDLPRVIEETCVALIPYPAVSSETIPEPSPQAETEDVHVQDSLGREAAQYTPLFSYGDTQCMPSSPPRFLHSRTDFFTPQPGVVEAESYTTEAFTICLSDAGTFCEYSHIS